MAQSDFWEIFFPAENAGNMLEIAVFADSFLYIVIFSHKNIIYNNANH